MSAGGCDVILIPTGKLVDVGVGVDVRVVVVVGVGV
jgi:ethanolamine utilization protein EutQ (cupin superfamily)